MSTVYHRSRVHPWDCNCDKCHEQHDISENISFRDFQCCKDEVDALREENKWCEIHRCIKDEGTKEKPLCISCLE